MSNVIQFLERLGQDAGAIRSDGTVLNQLAADVGVSVAVVEALKIGDQTSLTALLGGRTNVFCGIFPASPEEEEEEEKPQDDDKNPDKGTEKGLKHNRSRAAIAF